MISPDPDRSWQKQGEDQKRLYQLLDIPRFFVALVFGTESDRAGGGLGAFLFSKGLRDCVDPGWDLPLCLGPVLGVQTMPFMTTPLTRSSLVTVRDAAEPRVWSSPSGGSSSSSSSPSRPPGLVVMLELEAEADRGKPREVAAGGSGEVGTFTHRLRGDR